MTKKRLLYTVLSLALVLNLVIGAGIYLTYAEGGDKNDAYKYYELFARVLEQVRDEYVDGDTLTYQDLTYGALKGMLSTLDPHSEFMERDKVDELRKDTEGMFGGVGLVVVPRDGKLTVVSPIEGTPAYRAGIVTGDQILTIDGRSTDRMGPEESVKSLRGEAGTTVVITTLRPSSGQTREIKLTRAIVNVPTVRDLQGKGDFPLSEHGIGYVRLSQFGEQTSSELDGALKKLEQEGMRALILDLRGNPGGLLDQAIKVCEKFLPRNQLIVSTEGQHAEEQSKARATRRGRYVDLPLVILVNGGSASAAEIVAGCLQDTTAAGVSRVVLVGEQTFGKGSVQKIFPLSDGVAFRMTTARYYTPSHRVIHKKGIIPDIVVPMTDDQEEALRFRAQNEAPSLSAETQARVDEVHDVQLERAMEVLKGFDLYSKRSNAGARASAQRNAKAQDAN
jgi:carboxyl-terminal processing protease